MNRRLALALGVAAVGLLAVGVALAVAIRGDESEPAPELRALEVEHCRDFADDDARSCYSREFLALVDGQHDPRPAVQRITDAARSEGGFLLENCHVVMHTVGRTYARDAGVTLGHTDELPAAQTTTRAARPGSRRAGHRRGAGASTRASRARRASARARRRHPLPALQLRARLRPRLHAPLRGPARAGARALHRARAGDRARLRAGRVPRLLVRGRRRRRRKAAGEAVKDPYGCVPPSRRPTCAPAGTGRSWRTAPRASASRRRDIEDLCDGLAACSARAA